MSNDIANKTEQSSQDKGLLRKIKDGLKSKTAKWLAIAGIAASTPSCYIHQYCAEQYIRAGQDTNYECSDPYAFQRHSIYLINNRQWQFSYFRSEQSTFYFHSYTGNSQIFLQISIGDIQRYDIQYYNPYIGVFTPFVHKDYYRCLEHQKVHGPPPNNQRTDRPLRNDKYPLDNNYQPNLNSNNGNNAKNGRER